MPALSDTETEARLKEILGGDPDNVRALLDLSQACAARGDTEEALVHLRRAAELTGSYEIYNNLGGLEEQSGDLEAAIRSYRRAAGLAPASPVPLINLADALLRRGETDEAVDCLRVAATLDPERPEAWSLLGREMLSRGDPERAVGPLGRAAELLPDDAGALLLHADALQSTGKLDEAIAAYGRVLALDADSPAAWYGLGHAELDAGRHAAAVRSIGRFLEIEPDDGSARYDLGKALHDLGRVPQAMAELRRAEALGPRDVSAAARHTMAVVAPGDPDSDNRAVLALRREAAPAGTSAAPAGASAAPASRIANKPLRIGYVSSFFDRRNWMKPVWGLINRHDRARFEIHLFSDNPPARIDAGYRAHADDQIHYIGDASNEAVSRTIADNGIDLLIDLNGYSRADRLPLFAHRPAPVIAGWFNMYATTGMDQFDYLIGDRHVIPPDEETHYSERILRAPGSYLTFEVAYEVPDVSPPPSGRGGAVTFGSLTSQYKITDQVVACWAGILAQCDGARLLLKNAALGNEDNRDDLRRRFAANGIEPDRLILDGPSEHYDFLTAYGRIDVALDTFPYNGGTTTTEAIWQGVPVVTYHGDRWASRTSASILREAGLGEFVASDLDGYVAKCLELAAAPARLGELRGGMRDMLRRSSVCATERFARDMEALYLQMA